MKRLPTALFLFLAPLLAFAQKAAEDAPVEKASMTTVLVFLALFFGSIVAYGAWLWWRARAGKREG